MFEELTVNKPWVEELRRIYHNGTDQLDLMICMYAELYEEHPPKGFGFSDTAFRIFILISSRRLNSDRFFTTDYNPTVYSQVGFDWLDQNDMTTVLLRHLPALKPMLAKVKNPFAPWLKAKARGELAKAFTQTQVSNSGTKFESYRKCFDPTERLVNQYFRQLLKQRERKTI